MSDADALAHTFGIKTPQEWLDKARYELAGLEALCDRKLTGQEAKAMQYAAINTALALWHMVDWLANSDDAKIRSALAAAGLHDLEQLHAHARKQSDAVGLCWLLATAAKHAKLTGRAKAKNVIEETTLSIASTLAKPAYGRYVPKIISGGKRHNAVQVFKDAISYWDGFLTTHHIGGGP